MDENWPDSFKVHNFSNCKNLEITMHVVVFEVRQMINTFIAMQHAAVSPANTGYTAYLESCLLHIRNLMEFMIDNPDPTKITFRDFVPEGHSPVCISLDLNPIRELINQHLVHMDWKRTVPSTSSLPPVEKVIQSTVVALADAFGSFVELLPIESKERRFFENSTHASLGKIGRVSANSLS